MDIKLCFITYFLFFCKTKNFEINIQIQIPKQRISQRDYYDGRKGYHCKNYLFVHDGSGKAIYIHGGERGALNDITLLRGSSFGRNIDQYVAFGDYVLCDGAWRNEGPPYLCRFTDRNTLSTIQLAYNYVLSDKRVICENYYGRMHGLFPILNYFQQRIDKLDIYVRAIAVLTNIHLKYQSPLRHNIN